VFGGDLAVKLLNCCGYLGFSGDRTSR
jgi:hypothetical protein